MSTLIYTHFITTMSGTSIHVHSIVNQKSAQVKTQCPKLSKKGLYIVLNTVQCNTNQKHASLNENSLEVQTYLIYENLSLVHSGRTSNALLSDNNKTAQSWLQIMSPSARLPPQDTSQHL